MYSPRLGFAYRPKPKIFKRDGDPRRLWHQLQHWAVQPLRAEAGLPDAVRRNADEQRYNCHCRRHGRLHTTNLTLANGFNCSTVAVQNNYAVNQNYRLGHVQVWNIDIQRTFPLGIVANIGYNGAKGGDLDIVRVPNRTATGLLNPSAQAFSFEDSLASSRFQTLSVNVRKRLQKGVSLQATYLYSHSIDDASSIGGSTPVPAQNDLDLAAEESNSSFDIRHHLAGNW